MELDFFKLAPAFVCCAAIGADAFAFDGRDKEEVFAGAEPTGRRSTVPPDDRDGFPLPFATLIIWCDEIGLAGDRAAGLPGDTLRALRTPTEPVGTRRRFEGNTRRLSRSGSGGNTDGFPLASRRQCR